MIAGFPIILTAGHADALSCIQLEWPQLARWQWWAATLPGACAGWPAACSCQGSCCKPAGCCLARPAKWCIFGPFLPSLSCCHILHTYSLPLMLHFAHLDRSVLTPMHVQAHMLHARLSSSRFASSIFMAAVWLCSPAVFTTQVDVSGIGLWYLQGQAIRECSPA